ncbi:uncharacterized protein METZ01_LOCUS169872, partial [marine metagenome]
RTVRHCSPRRRSTTGPPCASASSIRVPRSGTSRRSSPRSP